jgi:uncharacterized protein YcfJ
MMSMSDFRIVLAGAAAALLICGCVTEPMGPSINVMPAPNKPFSVFQDDQAVCKQYASQQVAGQADEANNRAVGTAAIGTVLGAGLGAAIGGGRGAAVGAGTGAVVGTAAGSGPADMSQYGIQRRYDMAYAQCMYSRGNQVPGYGAAVRPPPPRYVPPPPYYPPPPPPPPGYYPPPPGP